MDKNLQNLQNLQKKQKTCMHDLLEEKYQKAIQYRLQGYKYRRIALLLRPLKEQSIREWFAKGGILHNAYEEYKRLKRSEDEDEFSEIDFQLKDLSIDAVSVLRNHIDNNSLKAALEVLDRIGFGKKDNSYDREMPVVGAPRNEYEAELTERVIIRTMEYARTKLISDN